MKKIWTHCHICRRGIREENPKKDFIVRSSLVYAEKDVYEPHLMEPSYYLKMCFEHEDTSPFYMCKRCIIKLEEGFKRLIKRFEKEYGSKKRFTSTAKGEKE